MGNNNSRRIEILEKRNIKIQEKLEDNQKNIERLVNIVAKTPGPCLELDHLKINKTFMLQDPTSKKYIFISYDSKTNEFKLENNTHFKDEYKCILM